MDFLLKIIMGERCLFGCLACAVFFLCVCVCFFYISFVFYVFLSFVVHLLHLKRKAKESIKDAVKLLKFLAPAFADLFGRRRWADMQFFLMLMHLCTNNLTLSFLRAFLRLGLD